MIKNKWIVRAKFIFLGLSLLALTACRPNNSSLQGYIEGYFTYLAANSSGYLQQLDVARGDAVQKDQVLFELDNQPESARLDAAKAQLVQAQHNLANAEQGQRETILQGIQAQIQQTTANLALAEKTLQRNQQLIATQAIAQQTYDQAKANYLAQKGQLAQLIANLNEARLGSRNEVIQAAAAAVLSAQADVTQASYFVVKKTVVAPQPGHVFDTYYRLGEWVDAGKPVLSLLIPTDIRVIFYVPESLLSQVKIGQRVKINCDSCQKATIATISYLSANAEYTPPIIFSEKERQKFVYRAEAVMSIADAQKLHPGQPVDVSLSLN